MKIGFVGLGVTGFPMAGYSSLFARKQHNPYNKPDPS
jgi:3-hydroxyisobutyrate dehydrogenase-like beta-hydroxyacid dehydrogenase